MSEDLQELMEKACFEVEEEFVDLPDGFTFWIEDWDDYFGQS